MQRLQGSIWCVAVLLWLMVLQPSPCIAGFAGSESRRLLDVADGGHFTSTVAAQCTTNFAKLDYTPITSACKGPDYEKSSCCTAFNTLACKYKAQVNDFSSTCPIEFMSYLNKAGGYRDGVFLGRCNSNNKICSY